MSNCRVGQKRVIVSAVLLAAAIIPLLLWTRISDKEISAQQKGKSVFHVPQFLNVHSFLYGYEKRSVWSREWWRPGPSR